MENGEDEESLEEILSFFMDNPCIEVMRASIPEKFIKVFRIISDEYEVKIIEEHISEPSGNLNIKVKDRMRKTAEVLKRTIGVI
jgi:hypothetical protein